MFEQDAYADRAFRTAAEGLDERERAFAQRLAYGAVQRVRTLDHAIETLGKRPVRKLDPPVRAALRLGAYQLGYTRYRAACGGRTSRSSSSAARGSSGPFRSRTRSCGGSPTGSGRSLESLPDGPLKESYPDWIHEVFVRVLGDDGALALMRAQNEPLETVVRLVRGDPPSGEPTDVPGALPRRACRRGGVAEGRIWPQSRGSQLAGLVRRLAGGRARARPLCRSGRQDGAAARRGRRRSRSTRHARASCARTSRGCGATT